MRWVTSRPWATKARNFSGAFLGSLLTAARMTAPETALAVRNSPGGTGGAAGGAAGRDPSPPDGFAFGEGVGDEAHGIGEEGLVEQQRDELPGMEIRAGQRHGLVAEFGHGGEGERLRIGVRGGGAHIS